VENFYNKYIYSTASRSSSFSVKQINAILGWLNIKDKVVVDGVYLHFQYFVLLWFKKRYICYRNLQLLNRAIIIKTKVLIPSSIGDNNRFWLSCVCPLVVLLPNILNLNLNFVLSATFSNISSISWRPVLVVEKAGLPGENHRPWANVKIFGETRVAQWVR
jgi:hypothetical protein